MTFWNSMMLKWSHYIFLFSQLKTSETLEKIQLFHTEQINSITLLNHPFYITKSLTGYLPHMHFIFTSTFCIVNNSVGCTLRHYRSGSTQIQVMACYLKAPNHCLNYVDSSWMRTSSTHFNEMLFRIHKLSVKKMYLKVSPAKCRPFCSSGFNALTHSGLFAAYVSRSRSALIKKWFSAIGHQAIM